MAEYDVVLKHIPYDVPITRRELRARTGLSDRKIRRLIAAAEEAGEFIVNNGNGAGYYRTLDLDEIEKAYLKDRAYAMSILKKNKKRLAWLKLNGRLIKNGKENV